MISGGFTFFAGALSNGASQNISMLILGRILLGFGVGFANQSKLKGFKYIAFESLLRLRRDLNHDLPEFLFHSCDTPFGTELADLIKFIEVARTSKEDPSATIFKRQYKPDLVMSIAKPFFQQMSGINIIAFYSPFLFRLMGLGNNSSLLGAIILGLVLSPQF
ncbi:hypothetical protein T459_12665 [Capsicum annuum]|uniref:Uncharacterized protein n=1 Tax=Capsicum annuum TaxID=4072 RepID=A0A2G2ZQG5_CAPAN|nr:hypothetical protein T459_12665 [Capsicum annuum]